MKTYKEVMDHAVKLYSDRGDNYGTYKELLRKQAVLSGMIKGANLSDYDVAMDMVALKLARIIVNPCLLDSYVDLINYVAFAATLAPEKVDIDEDVKRIAAMFGANANPEKKCRLEPK